MQERPEWGALNFKGADGTMARLRQLVGLILDLPLDLAPDHIIQNSDSYLGTVANVLERIDQFDSEQSTGADRDALIAELTDSTQNTLNEIGAWIAVAGMLSGKLQEWTTQAKQTRDGLQEALSGARDYVADKRSEIEAAVDAARAASAKAGAAAFTQDFLTEADTRRTQGKKWLRASIGSAVSALLMAAWFIFGWGIEEADSAWQTAVNIGGRVMGFSVLLYAAVWCGRLVLANLHQESVNRHRANSIKTLQAFREAATDSDVKDAVVLEAARATFENVPPGFVSKGTKPSLGAIRVMETLRRTTASRTESR